MLINKNRTREGLASALPGSGPKLVEDADALVLQETLTRFGLNSHHQRDLEVKRSEEPPAVDQAACQSDAYMYCIVRAFRWQTMDASVIRLHQRGPEKIVDLKSNCRSETIGSKRTLASIC